MRKRRTNDFTHEYISEVKALFPIIGKNERRYLAQLRRNLTDYCEDMPVASINMLYEEFGMPQDAVYTYYSMMDMEQLISLIHMGKMIRRFFLALLIVVLAFFIYLSAIIYEEHLACIRTEPVFIDTVIANTEVMPSIRCSSSGVVSESRCG